jgi:hypothetical protein
VLYECLTGRVPFEKDLDAAIIWAHVEETPTMPTVLRPDLPPEIDEVFGRVLSKRPDERYGSCREFVEAARLALGIFRSGTEASFAYGTSASGPQTDAPPVSRAETPPPDQFSWSTMTSRVHSGGPVAPSAPAAYGQPSHEAPPGAGRSGPSHSGGTIASHRREYGVAGPGEPGPPAAAPAPSPGGPREPQWYRRPRWIAVLTAVVLVLAGVGTWVGLSGSGSHAKAAMTMSHTPKPKPTPSPLMAALVLANKSGDATGKLPPSTCKQTNATVVTCTAPAAGITGVVFQTYPNQKALYAAYTAKVTALNTNKFRQNFNDCGSQATFGEVGWNHLFKHSRSFTVDQMIMGTVRDDQGRGPGVLQLHPGPGVHGLDAERRPPHGLRGRPGAHRRVGLVGGGAPQHRHRRLADGHEYADPLHERRRRIPLDEPVPVHERHVRVPVRVDGRHVIARSRFARYPS